MHIVSLRCAFVDFASYKNAYFNNNLYWNVKYIECSTLQVTLYQFNVKCEKVFSNTKYITFYCFSILGPNACNGIGPINKYVL